ncbi:hypothetical protein [Cytobacillus purgationiresistens]|uniref:Flagellar protein FliT n=1 Tax=Cytobacillus purgationiresistens TaxID=863449 RepID=A0ABU0ACV0_9BACI|nr:hypothetical protein [Cytobacillus purgationiresistens]MDQ0269084.1 hypothetical protein [Cytobacillus purgationiresistens]
MLRCNAAFLIHLQTGLPEDGREEYISATEQFLEERGEMLPLIEFANAEANRLKEQLIQQDQEIHRILQAHQALIKEDIKQLKLQREKKKHYANPYQSVQQHDGTFYDKRN